MKSDVVVDASIALKWILTESDSQAALALYKDWLSKEKNVIAPELLTYEVTNTLYRATRDNRISMETVKKGIDLIHTIVDLDIVQGPDFNYRAAELAKRFDLSASYDTHYLALAEQKGCELWSSDTRMWRAVKGQLDWVHCLSDFLQTN